MFVFVILWEPSVLLCFKLFFVLCFVFFLRFDGSIGGFVFSYFDCFLFLMMFMFLFFDFFSFLFFVGHKLGGTTRDHPDGHLLF